MMRGSFLRAGGARGGTRRPQLSTSEVDTSDILQLKQEMVLSTSDLFQMNEGCQFYRVRRAALHVGRCTSDFPSSPSKLSCLRRASSLPLALFRLRPGLPNQLIRAEKAAAKRTYFYQKSCLLPRFFAAFGSFWDFLFKTATERWLSPQNCLVLGPRAFFYS